VAGLRLVHWGATVQGFSIMHTETALFDLNGGMLTAQLLEMILRELENSGSVKIINCRRGGCRLLEIGAYLAETARRTANDKETK
jgi:hypothetical protein